MPLGVHRWRRLIENVALPRSRTAPPRFPKSPRRTYATSDRHSRSDGSSNQSSSGRRHQSWRTWAFAPSYVLQRLFDAMPEPRTFLSRLVLWFPIVYLLNEHCFTAVLISGKSMQPTLNPDASGLKRDWVLVSRISRYFDNYRRGDVVTFWHPFNGDLIVKRILALEGDIVKTLRPNPDKYVRVPRGHCWVEGDEGFHSRDSNAFGPIPLGLIDGRLEAIITPLSRTGPLPAPPPSGQRVLRSRASSTSIGSSASNQVSL